jgi:hypothetical protein
MNSGTQAIDGIAQRLHSGVEQRARQPPIARDGAEQGASDHAEAEPGADAQQGRRDMARQVAGARQFDNGGKNPARRRHQPSVGQAEPDHQLPRQ